MMEFTTLGRTGLRVSRMGLGGGGHSRLGMSQGKTEAEAADIVRRALDLGVNFFDTAEGYRTETAIGLGIAGVSRDRVVISTKAGVDYQDRQCTPSEMKERVNACLDRVNTDYVDVFHLHGVSAGEYPYGRDALVPALQDLQQEGKIRFLGITEQFIHDPSHRMLQLALEDDCWDVIMVGFNLLNPSARQTVFPKTQKKGIGTLGMFAVRRALSRPEALSELLEELEIRGEVSREAFDAGDPLRFVWQGGVASSLQEAAYRFCRHEPGMDVVLSGTGNADHLTANAASVGGPPLPDEVLARLEKIFGRVDSVSGN